MEKHEVDKLIADIQEYLKNGNRKPQPESGNTKHAEERTGVFIPPNSHVRMGWLLKYSSLACYAVEALTIGLFTGCMLWRSESLSTKLMVLMGVLLVGIFMVTVLLSLQARIRLLLRIEMNTRCIALSKARLIKAIEGIRTE
ncbi:MAG: hypothetical protein Kow0099_27920 [Candidatus Abyssubacteria bacterium]